METTKTKAAIAAQISKLQASANVQQAKTWWSSLSPMHKAIAIGILAGATAGVATYFGTVGAVSGVVTNGVAAAGSIITPYQAFWNAVLVASISGGIAGYMVHNHYTAAASPVIQEEFDINA